MKKLAVLLDHVAVQDEDLQVHTHTADDIERKFDITNGAKIAGLQNVRNTIKDFENYLGWP